MKFLSPFLLWIFITVFLPSCQFKCAVGKNDEDVKGTAVVKDGARVYNNIELNTSGVKVSKAYLFTDGKRVPDDNFVDFESPVKMQLIIDDGWVEKDGKVLLGASEKITEEDGSVVLSESDLFEKYPDGISVSDSKSVYLTAALKLKKGAAPASFTVSFRI